MKYIGLFIIACCCSCKKDWLLVKQDKSLVVPTTLADLQGLMDRDFILNDASRHPATLAQLGTDVTIMPQRVYDNIHNPTITNTYAFRKLIFSPIDGVEFYNTPYRRIFYANAVVGGLTNVVVTPTNRDAYRAVLGTALFTRAYNLWWVAQLFAPAFDAASAASPGIPIRLTSDINASTSRATVQEDYDRILADAAEAAALLPDHTTYRNRPSRATAYALLARTKLSMRDYPAALLYADSSLQLSHDLMDYNLLDSTATYPVNHDYSYSTEVLYSDITTNFFSGGLCAADTTLYRSLDPNDLRKVILFKISPSDGLPHFFGSYQGDYKLFVGMSVAELYLIKAECLARAGNAAGAMGVLNEFLPFRWKTGTFVPYASSDPETALSTVLLERKRELCFQGLRWTDLRRLNLEPGHETTVIHQESDSVFTLPPKSTLYVLPFPDEVIKLTGISQNGR